jgi:riboflavin kinase/FMN adenylyltransferase
LVNFTGDLYGKDLEISFIEKLRDEQKFPSLDALKQQISRDLETANSRWPLLPLPTDGRAMG